MNSSFRFDADSDGSIRVLGQDGQRVLGRGWRMRPDGTRIPVLAVWPAAEPPTPVSLHRLEHEYGLKDELDSAWAVRPLELVREGGRTVLVLEDPDGEPLERLLDAPMEVGRFLRLAIGIAAALGQVHRRGLVHKDLKPAHILVNSTTGEVKLTGFGIASRLPRERQAAAPPEEIAGTLAYMAPEQTGRMNRSIDARSDLYALGVTFYQILTSTLPFAAANPLEWVHCHIARQPMPPIERRKGIPAAISAIVMKLLAKTAEERYQTAAGVESDLRRCLAAWERGRRIEDFTLGQHDRPDRLLISEKLYGREREIATLVAAFDRVVKSGVPELVLVSGYSGIGKSSVVHELHKVLVPKRGLFASSKFDQYKRDIPYATLAQAIQVLIRGLLTKSEVELAGWRGALLDALGPNGQLMIDVVPELRLIIGEPLPVPELDPQQAQRRFQLVFRRFIGVFARPEYPLALFLDDLQWLDAATLDLFEDLLTQPDVRHLLLIGAYRDNEVTPAHPLMRRLSAIRAANTSVQEIVLAPLRQADVGRLIGDSLRCEPDRAAALARLVHKKTAGNPFFTIQFLIAVTEEGLLAIDHRQGRWSWDNEHIRAKGYTDNVVDLMVAKITRLPVKTQMALQQLACLGETASVRTLSLVSGMTEEQVHAALGEAVRTELVERSVGLYRFIHDRVQEAAYSLIPAALRADTHLRIGRLLAAQTPPEKREEAIFEIVSQLNHGAALITDQDEREQLAELNLIAGKRAKASTAYAAALNYLTGGAALLPKDSWERRHALTFQLELNCAECQFLTGELAAADERLTALADRGANTVERANVACLHIDLYTTLGQSERAVAVGLGYLRHLGINWSPHPTEEEARREYEQIWAQLGGRTIDDLVELPFMNDPSARTTLDVLVKLSLSVLSTDTRLHSLAICRAVNLSIEHGNCDASCAAYAYLGMVAGPRFGDYNAGFRFGRLGYELVERHGLRRFQARTYLCFINHVLPWTRHVRSGRNLLRRAFEAANEIGDLTFAATSFSITITNLLAAGDSLIEAQREAETGLDFARNSRFGLIIDLIIAQLSFIRTLRGLTPTFGCFDDKQFNELQFEQHLACNPTLALAACRYWIRKLQARFLAGDCQSAIQACSKAEELLWVAATLFDEAEYHFYGALARAAYYDAAPAQDRPSLLLALRAHHKQLAGWAEHCPENFENRAALVGAEIARLEGRDLEAMQLYEQAIQSARANGFIQNEALACELAARFYAARGFETNSQAHLRKARHEYLRWGADGKVRQLGALYPHLEEEDRSPDPMRTIGAPVEHLDLATVITVSQTVSGEIVLEKLIDTLLRTAIEHAGAERGLLILLRAAEQYIAAEATTRGDTVVVQLRDEPVTAALLPEAVLHYVWRTRESVVLDDASAENPFAEDPYIQQHHARSILCLPVLNQATLIGVLYLENNLTPRVFAPARITLLKLLASQAAISLENTRLYRNLAEREARIRRLVEANIIGIFIWELEGRIIEANDAFLRIVGHERKELVAGRLRWTDLTPPEYQPADQGAAEEIRQTGSCRPYEKEFLRKDGSRVPVLLGGTIFEESRTQGVAFVLDLTERKQAEDALRRSEHYLTEAQRLSHTGSWAYNPATGKAIYWSEEMFRIHGLDPQRDPAPYLNELPRFWHPDDRDRVLERVRTTIREKAEYAIEQKIVLPDGTVKYLHAIGHPVFDDAGALVEYFGTVMDITERKRAEEALHEAQAELAHVTRVTTMTALTASIAHEVNQPLGAIVTNANAALRWLARQPPELDEARETLERIARDGHRAGEVIRRVRALLRKTTSFRERVDLNNLVQDTIALVQGEVRRQRILLRTALAPDLPPVVGDRVQVQQVLLNLVLNGIEAMKEVAERPRELVISSGREASNGVRVAVRDAGVGLAPQNVERVFEAFYTTKPDGMGIGLAICRSIIEAHGGRLWASANEPHGAMFQFTLPAEPDEIAPAEHASSLPLM